MGIDEGPMGAPRVGISGAKVSLEDDDEEWYASHVTYHYHRPRHEDRYRSGQGHIGDHRHNRHGQDLTGE